MIYIITLWIRWATALAEWNTNRYTFTSFRTHTTSPRWSGCVSAVWWRGQVRLACLWSLPRPLSPPSSHRASLFATKQTRPLIFFGQITCYMFLVLFTFSLLFLLKSQRTANSTLFGSMVTTHTLHFFSSGHSISFLSHPWDFLQSSPRPSSALLQRLWRSRGESWAFSLITPVGIWKEG